MHSLLSKIGNCLGIDLDKKLNQALVFTSLKYRFENLSTYKDKIKRLVNQPSLEFIFSIPQAEVSCEKEVVNRLGQAKRIDRLVVKDKEVLVIDYKSSDQAQDAQGAQVAQYMEIAGDIYPTKKIRGFLVYLDKMKAQEVWKK
jgi:ribonucleoside-diphosphate reductase beta chain/exodeoxyribonuclease V beta subunit